MIIEKNRQRLRRVTSVAKWMDGKFSIPGTSFRFGLDALIGLVPGVGDTGMMLVSLWIVFQAHRAGVPLPAKLKMLLNVLLDWVIGSIPLVGDIFDVTWRANQRNARIFADYVDDRVL